MILTAFRTADCNVAMCGLRFEIIVSGTHRQIYVENDQNFKFKKMMGYV